MKNKPKLTIKQFSTFTKTIIFKTYLIICGMLFFVQETSAQPSAGTNLIIKLFSGILVAAAVFGLGRGTYRLATGDQEGKKDFLLIAVAAVVWGLKEAVMAIFA